MKRFFLTTGLCLTLVVLAMCIPLVSAAESLPNLYSPYPVVSNIASGISWPQGQALPTFATPFPVLDTILVQDLGPDEEITFSALQGLVNKTRPRIYLLDSGADEGTYTWAGTSIVNFSSRISYSSSTRYSLVSKYAAQVAGLVLYDPSKSIHYRNLASTVAGLRNALPVTPDIRAQLVNRGINLPVLVDLTTLPYTTPVQIYNHLYETWWPECTKRLFVSADPADDGDLHHTRDIAAAVGAVVLWLDSRNTAERDMFRKFLADMTPGDAIGLGWYATERSGIVNATRYGIGTIPANFYISGSVYAGTDRRIRIPRVPPKPALANKIYITIFISDGDNAQYMQRAMRKIWDQNASSRGRYPMNWTVAPGMVDLGPALLNYYYTTATPNDCFVAGPSGMGYIMPVNTASENGAPSGTHLESEAAMDGYARLTETYMQRAGLRVLTVWDNATSMHRASYERHVRNLYGATVQRFSGRSTVNPSIENDRIRFDRLVQAYSQTYANIRDALDTQIASWNGSAPLFLSTQVSVWGEMKPNRIVDLCNELNARHPGKLVFVRADHYFALFNEANNLPFNAVMSGQTAVTSSDTGSNAALAGDGTAYTMWASSASGKRSITFDLGRLYNLDRCVVRHAGDTGMSRNLNTRAYRFQVSANAYTWSTIDARTNNEDNVTDVEFPLVTARYARIVVDDPGADGVARIADVELFGRNPLETFFPEPDPSFNAWMDALPDEEKPPEDQRGHHDKPAGDGMSNLLKYALGLKPLTPSGQEAPRVSAFTGEKLAVEVTRAIATTARIGIEASTDLEKWTPVDFTVERQEDVGADRERVHFAVDAPDEGAYFLRLRVDLDE